MADKSTDGAGLRDRAMVAAAAVEDSLRGQQVARLEVLRGAHTADVLGYHLECRRWGDFLSLLIRRGSERYAGAVNLREVSVLTPHLTGREPGMDGIINIYAPVDPHGVYSSDAFKDGWPLRHDGCELSETYDLIDVPQAVHTVHVTCSGGGGGGGGSCSPPRIQLREMKNCARPAEDDALEFTGTGITLYVPAGLGQRTYETILRELGAPQS